MAEQECDFFPGVVGATGCAVVFSEGLTGDGVEAPLGRPIKSPREFSFALFDV